MRGVCRNLLFNDGYIYFVQMGLVGPIKIGYTRNVNKRIASLQTASPYRLILLCVMPGTEDYEKDIHEGLDEIRLEGEWFLPHEMLMRDIHTIIESIKRDPISPIDFTDEKMP